MIMNRPMLSFDSVRYWLLMLPLLLFPACEKVLIRADKDTNPVSVFDEIWKFADTHYSFFEYKGIDWNQVYNHYRPQVSNDMGEVALFDLCARMLNELRDGHVNLISSFDRSRYSDFYLESPENFSYALLERQYFKDRHRQIGPLQFVMIDNIAYVYYHSFASTISQGNMDLLIANLKDRDGLIIDVRNNGGGSTQNAKMFASRFTDEKRLLGYNHIKTGPGHEDFRQEGVYIEPHDGSRYNGPVVVLTNRKSYSATTYFAQYMRTLPNVTLIGDTTGGGGGMPAFRDLPNGWLVRVSCSRFYAPDGFNIESGIPPDISVNLRPQSISDGYDDILERAMAYIRNKHRNDIW
jgi:hypothetical protein